ncbi:putative transposase [Francisella tularensis]|uniref:Transposase n=1 Tax=Francisella tularensis TaxID=263 RepID=A0AAW3D3P8_FRATU|nr:putative transposase [Francisella tularensis]
MVTKLVSPSYGEVLAYQTQEEVLLLDIIMQIKIIALLEYSGYTNTEILINGLRNTYAHH